MQVIPSKKTTINLDYYIQSSYPPESEGKKKDLQVQIKKEFTAIPAFQHCRRYKKEFYTH